MHLPEQEIGTYQHGKILIKMAVFNLSSQDVGCAGRCFRAGLQNLHCPKRGWQGLWWPPLQPFAPSRAHCSQVTLLTALFQSTPKSLPGWRSPHHFFDILLMKSFSPFPTGISLAIACAYWLPNLCWAPHSAHLQWKMVFRLLFSLPASRTKSSVPPVVSFHIFLFSCLCSFPVALQSQKLTHHISINPATS